LNRSSSSFFRSSLRPFFSAVRRDTLRHRQGV
jgi:hypothetical protein